MTLLPMLRKQWQAEHDIISKTPSPEARFKTGVLKTDSHLQYLETVYGIDVYLTPGSRVERFEVVDEEKFMLFVLKWA